MKGRKLLSFLAVLMVWLLVASSALAITVDDTAREVYGDGDSITVTGDGEGHNTVSSNTSTSRMILMATTPFMAAVRMRMSEAPT
jgi:hypothetical protein